MMSKFVKRTETVQAETFGKAVAIRKLRWTIGSTDLTRQ